MWLARAAGGGLHIMHHLPSATLLLMGSPRRATERTTRVAHTTNTASQKNGLSIERTPKTRAAKSSSQAGWDHEILFYDVLILE